MVQFRHSVWIESTVKLRAFEGIQDGEITLGEMSRIEKELESEVASRILNTFSGWHGLTVETKVEPEYKWLKEVE